MIRIIHYVNQFFGQFGGEEKAAMPPKVIKGPIGPGILINQLMEGRGSHCNTNLRRQLFF